MHVSEALLLLLLRPEIYNWRRPAFCSFISRLPGFLLLRRSKFVFVGQTHQIDFESDLLAYPWAILKFIFCCCYGSHCWFGSTIWEISTLQRIVSFFTQWTHFRSSELVFLPFWLLWCYQYFKEQNNCLFILWIVTHDANIRVRICVLQVFCINVINIFSTALINMSNHSFSDCISMICS